MVKNRDPGDVSWYVPNKKRPIAYSTVATSNLIGLLAEDGLTVQQARDALLYDREGQGVMDAYIGLGYGDKTLASLGVR